MNTPQHRLFGNSAAFVRGAALTALLGLTLGLAQEAAAPFIITSSGSRISGATLQAYNSAGGIAAVVGNTRSGASDAALILSQAGNGQFIKAFGPNGGEHEFEVAANGTVSLIAPNLQTNIRLDNSNGVVTAKGFNNRSDRQAKANFVGVDPARMLALVARLPISRWNYKDDARSVQHIGPMAQDFEAAFGLNGGDTRSINTVDVQGVTLAAVQGLNAHLETENARLSARMDALEAQMSALASE
jgi:Chaperone of endosialidase